MSTDPSEEPPIDPQQQPAPAPQEEPSYGAYQELGSEQAPPPPQLNTPDQGTPPPPPPEIMPEQPPVAGHTRTPSTRTRGRGQRKVATGGKQSTSRPGYRGRPTSRSAPVQGEGISVFSVLLALVALGLLAVVGMILMPKELDFIKGYSSGDTLIKTKPRNLLEEAQKVMLKRGGEDLVFTEEEVNAYLSHRLQGSQAGALGSLIQYKGCYVDFTKGNAEFFIERSIFGFPLTMSSKIHIKRFREEVQWTSAGGTIGKFTLGSKQLKPIVEAFKRMRGNFDDERLVMAQMVDVKFEEDKVILDSSF